nr:hypothetical protein CFP56_09494 [Quercus suber]
MQVLDNTFWTMLARLHHLLLAIALANKVLAQVNCYYGPDPTDIDPTMQGCPGVTESNPGPCCRNDGDVVVDLCLSNGLCWSAADMFVYEGQCTDQSFGAPGCLANCRGLGTNMGSGNFYSVSLCSEDTWCCGLVGDAASCCSTGVGRFKYHIATDHDLTFLGPLNASTLVSVTNNATISRALAGNDSTSLLHSTTTASNTAGATGTGTAAVRDGSVPSGYVKTSAVIGVGVGLGVPLIVALATIAWLMAGMRKKSSTDFTAQPPQEHEEKLTGLPAMLKSSRPLHAPKRSEDSSPQWQSQHDDPRRLVEAAALFHRTLPRNVKGNLRSRYLFSGHDQPGRWRIARTHVLPTLIRSTAEPWGPGRPASGTPCAYLGLPTQCAVQPVCSSIAYIDVLPALVLSSSSCCGRSPVDCDRLPPTGASQHILATYRTCGATEEMSAPPLQVIQIGRTPIVLSPHIPNLGQPPFDPPQTQASTEGIAPNCARCY